RDRLRLALEALADLLARREVRRKDLHRDVAAEPRVLRAVDLAHASGADRREDLVGAQLRSVRERHFFLSSAVQSDTNRICAEELSAAGTAIRRRLPSADASSGPRGGTLPPKTSRGAARRSAPFVSSMSTAKSLPSLGWV